MIFSRSCEYGIRAIVYLAARDGAQDRYWSIKEISDELDISYHFLTKTLQKLTEQEILESYRGPAGGVRLAKPAAEVALKDIVLAIDGPELFEECILGLPGCGEQRPCPIHDRWASVRDDLIEHLENYTLDRLARAVQDDEVRLKSELEPDL